MAPSASVDVVSEQHLLPEYNAGIAGSGQSQRPIRPCESFAGITVGINIEQSTTVVAVDDLPKRQFDLELR